MVEKLYWNLTHDWFLGLPWRRSIGASMGLPQGKILVIDTVSQNSLNIIKKEWKIDLVFNSYCIFLTKPALEPWGIDLGAPEDPPADLIKYRYWMIIGLFLHFRILRATKREKNMFPELLSSFFDKLIIKIFQNELFYKIERYLFLVTHIFTKLSQNMCLHVRRDYKLWNVFLIL